MFKIQTVTAGSAVPSVTLDVPTGYDDLYLVAQARTDRASQVDDQLKMTFNGSTSGYSERGLGGNGSSAFSFTGSASTSIQDIIWTTASNATSNTFGSSAVYIPNYRGSTAKSVSSDNVTENNATAASQAIMAGLWTGTDPITTITLSPLNGSNILQNSTFTLYGIRKYNTTGTPKATGGQITYANGYWVHTFAASGTFTPTQNLSNVEYLVIAGGGGGGSGDYYGGGGGGAGGYRCSVSGETSGRGSSAESAISLTASTAYTVTVGAGGTGGTTISGANAMTGISAGSNSSLAGSGLTTITSTGGGYGGGKLFNNYDGGAGGSGGGSNGDVANVYNPGGAGTSAQGYDGGSGFGNGTSFGASGGGGGAGSAGSNASNSSAIGGNGGNGIQSSITGTATYRAGGGGGGTNITGQTNGTGGLGGGGNGFDTTISSGSQTTGSGGGGKSGNGTGGAGGSGVVIIRYAA